MLVPVDICSLPSVSRESHNPLFHVYISSTGLGVHLEPITVFAADLLEAFTDQRDYSTLTWEAASLFLGELNGKEN